MSRLMPAMEVAAVTLDGSHVRMEPLSLERHFEGLCEVGLDADLWRWTTNRVRTSEELRAYIETALHEQAEGRSLPFATVDKPSGHIAGSTRFGNIDRHNRRVEIGWTWGGRPYQPTYVNTGATDLVPRH